LTVAQLHIPEKLLPIFEGEADVRGAYGGRGSAKTRTFAKMTAVRALMWDQMGRSGIILCARQFMNSLDDSSLEEVKAAIQSEEWLLPHFEIGEKYIRTRSGRVDYKFAGLDRNIASVKSKARVLLCWVDEAEPVTEQAWQVLIPTLREEDSELWVTWNPERRTSATHKRFREVDDDRMKVVEMNWRDNPWFPAILERKRLKDLTERPDSYEHIWEGDFVTVVEGAYYARLLADAKREGRIGHVAREPLMTLRAFWDIGGTGAKADATSIWIAQFVGREVRVLDYYEAVGQPLATHVAWLRENGYGKALCHLPHDGATKDKVHDVSFQSSLEAAGFEVEVVPNQGAGAARMRIESTRRLFPSIWFNEATTGPGRDALGWYHEKRDDERLIGLGPAHDWSSHGADAFGLMAVVYEPPAVVPARRRAYGERGGGSSTGWMVA
jgi:phage terminase large subunit